LKRIVFTGGGSAGHVTPNLALISKLQKQEWDIHYIGSKNGIEKELIQKTVVPYHGISSGKLRRYFDLKNFKDPFKVLNGVRQSYFLLRKLKPNVIFSKGGFVSVPVVIAGKLNNIPVYIHESDITPGLANKIATKFADKVFVTFEEAKIYFPENKVIHTGSPVREELLNGEKERGYSYLRFSQEKPVITIMGGSLGSVSVNNVVRDSLDDLLKDFQIVHICGKGNLVDDLEDRAGYRQFEYISEELPNVLALTDLIISRAGSNSIFEWLTLKKPMILIPLPKTSSRGDQILNAKSFENKGFCTVLYDEALSKDVLIKEIRELYKDKVSYAERMSEYATGNSIDEIIDYLKKA
jgi:UDP-N-acetylglucosamine--N-acetylmuramyl-(pentapeptide) pyrophosphoryl-undecaprenol N-acetylglucosamine transferase